MITIRNLRILTDTTIPLNPEFGLQRLEGETCYIYRGQLRSGTTVAIKTSARTSLISDDGLKEKLQKLLVIWARCNHPNIIQLVGRATFREDPAAVYQWHEYECLAHYLDKFPATDLYQLSARICEGIAHLHANNIIHGDLNANRILVSNDGIPRLQLSVLTSSTVTDAVGGCWRLPWTAPEIQQGFNRTMASDVYSLGMTILEVIACSPCWASPRVGSVHPPRPIWIPKNDAGNAVWDILCKCWSHNPEDRPSASQVGAVMRGVYQAPNGVIAEFRRPKLVVTEETTLQDLVSYFEQRPLMNYTNSLNITRITTAMVDTNLASVYRIEHSNRQHIAVKRVKHNTPYKRLKRAARELDCWASYQHNNILPILGFAVVGADIAMVSPWMSNGCVTDFVTRNPNCDRLGLCTQLARAVAYLHEHNVVHGDIKGPNVLVSDIETIQVADFGVSIVDHLEIEFSATSSGRGTQRWQAPEILEGKSDSTKEADVYALGMTMLEIYTGQQPYNSMNFFQATQAVIRGTLRPTRPMLLPIDAIGNDIWELMNHCWAGIPENRPTSDNVYERIRVLEIRSKVFR